MNTVLRSPSSKPRAFMSMTNCSSVPDTASARATDASLALPMIMPRSRSPTVIFSPGISQMEAPFWAFAAGEAVTAVFSDKAPDSRASAVSSMVISFAMVPMGRLSLLFSSSSSCPVRASSRT